MGSSNDLFGIVIELNWFISERKGHTEVNSLYTSIPHTQAQGVK